MSESLERLAKTLEGTANVYSVDESDKLVSLNKELATGCILIGHNAGPESFNLLVIPNKDCSAVIKRLKENIELE